MGQRVGRPPPLRCEVAIVAIQMCHAAARVALIPAEHLAWKDGVHADAAFHSHGAEETFWAARILEDFELKC